MSVLAWIGIALAAWVAASIAVGFALGSMIGRGWMRAPRRRDFAGMGLLVRLD